MKNDYELLYLIRGENDHIALEFLFHKYKRLIIKQLSVLQIQQKEHDDFIQEGLLMLLRAIHTFDEFKNKTFTRYYELILKRHFYQIKRRIPKYMEDEYNFDLMKSHYLEEDNSDFLEACSDFEQAVFQLYYVENKTIKFISESMGCSVKYIYNAIYRLKEKYKKYDII